MEYLRTTINGKRMRVHRLMMEQHLGRKLLNSEDVHHINGDIHDNRIQNLEVINHAEHSRRTMTGNKYLVGYKQTIEHKKNISLSMTGRKNHFYGRTHSQETKQKISRSMKEPRKSRVV